MQTFNNNLETLLQVTLHNSAVSLTLTRLQITLQGNIVPNTKFEKIQKGREIC